MNNGQRTVASMLAVVAVLLGRGAQAVVPGEITHPSFFDGKPVVRVDFEVFPGTQEILPLEQAFTDEFSCFGVVFSSEDVPGEFDTNDLNDVVGRFEAPWRILGDQGINGGPTSGDRMASGDSHSGGNTSDLRIDFPTPVSAFAFYLIDNNDDVWITAFSASGGAMANVLVPGVAEGGIIYRGWAQAIGQPAIVQVIIQGALWSPLDSTFIDELSFLPEQPFEDCNLNGVPDLCDILVTGSDLDGDGILDECDEQICIDIDGDGIVGVPDLLLLLAQWGPCPPICLADFDGDGVVAVPDLLTLLAAWGPCQ